MRFSKDLDEFLGDLDDGVAGDAGATTTKSFSLTDAGLDMEQRWILRVEEVAQ